MSNITEAFFGDIANKKYEPLLHSISGSIAWDVIGIGSWYVIIKNGEISVSRQKAHADTKVQVRREDFERMVLGKQNPATLFLQMKMLTEGNIGFLQVFQRLFPDENIMYSRKKGEKNEH